MADGIFNIAKGAWAEMVRDSTTDVILMLLKTSETESTLIDYDDVAAMLAGTPVEADFTNYARKTGLTGTLTVDDTNDRVDLDIADQTFSSAGGASNNTLVKVIIAYENAAADATRVPISHHDISVTTDGNDLTIEINGSGVCRAS